MSRADLGQLVLDFDFGFDVAVFARLLELLDEVLLGFLHLAGGVLAVVALQLVDGLLGGAEKLLRFRESGLGFGHFTAKLFAVGAQDRDEVLTPRDKRLGIDPLGLVAAELSLRPPAHLAGCLLDFGAHAGAPSCVIAAKMSRSLTMR